MARRTLRTAIDTSRAGRVVWEWYEDDGMIRAMFNGVIVRLTPEPPGYAVVIHEVFVTPPSEYTVAPESPDFPIVDEAYKAGRAVARDVDIVVEERLRKLEQSPKAARAG